MTLRQEDAWESKYKERSEGVRYNEVARMAMQGSGCAPAARKNA